MNKQFAGYLQKFETLISNLRNGLLKIPFSVLRTDLKLFSQNRTVLMKKLLLCMVLVLGMFKNSQLFSQDDETTLHGISAKLLFLDYNTLNSVDGFKVTNGLEIAYVRNLTQNLAFGFPIKIGVANIDGSDQKTTLVGADFIGQYQFGMQESRFKPYLFAGAGIVFEEFDNNNLQIPAGLGLYVRVGQSSFFTLQGEYRKSFDDQRDNLQLGVGWHFKLKQTPRPPEPLDSDGDGLPDAQDHCPNEAGSLAANGCPDTDGDGVPNGEDDCPTVKGSVNAKGCPEAGDRDGDGVPDDKDQCPDVYGTAELNGCPPKAPERPAINADRDGDGIVDEKDECPDEFGKIVLLGCPDRDGDGVADKYDRCPDEPGLANRNGCPPKDTDGDGILDEDDDCPTLAGKATLKGCPDTDNDGITDDKDACPTLPGVASAKGCPDADGDGVADQDDDCPNEAGPASNRGCIVRDADGDGILDKDDACPNEKGGAATNGCPDKDGDGVADKDDLCPEQAGLPTAKGCPDEDGDGTPDHLDKCPGEQGTNQGCPDIKKEDKEFLVLAAKNVQFETGKATLKAQSFATLDKVAEILLKYPKYNLMIAGHTDNVGDKTANQVLSEERAQSCYEYLLSRSVDPLRMQYQGFGSSKPIADNKTTTGRDANRRVEFNLYLK